MHSKISSQKCQKDRKTYMDDLERCQVSSVTTAKYEYDVTCHMSRLKSSRPLRGDRFVTNFELGRLSLRLMLIRPYKSVTLWHHLYHSNRLTTSQLIQQAYAPSSTTTSPEHLKRLQNDFFQLQKRPEAWGLVIPLLNHQDQNVHFFWLPK